MKTELDLCAAKIQRPDRSAVSIHRQLTDAVRTMICDGTLKEGARLPSSQELAKRWNTGPATVQSALTPLVKEGWLRRVSKQGTFVQKRQERLARVGVYIPETHLMSGNSSFSQSMRIQIKNVLDEQGIETDYWIDNRPEAEQRGPWTNLEIAAAERKIHALVIPQADWKILDWTNKLPIPTASFCTANLPNTVGMDYAQLVESSLDNLVAQGARSVGLISEFPLRSKRSGSSKDIYPREVEVFLDGARKRRLVVKKDWVRHESRDDEGSGVSPQAFGYREFRSLWAQSDHPEGLAITNDVVASGVIMAILEAQVSVPRDLKVVAHKNRHVELFSPFPVRHVVVDEREIAQALVGQIQKQFRGEMCERIMIQFRN